MPPFAPGSYALTKVKDTDDGERFQILFVNPDKSHKPGYMWDSSNPLTEEEAKDALRAHAAEADFPDLFRRAREHFESVKQAK